MVIYILCECSHIYAIACTIVVEAPRFAHQVGRRLRGLLSRWASLGPPRPAVATHLSNDLRDHGGTGFFLDVLGTGLRFVLMTAGYRVTGQEETEIAYWGAAF